MILELLAGTSVVIAAAVGVLHFVHLKKVKQSFEAAIKSVRSDFDAYGVSLKADLRRTETALREEIQTKALKNTVVVSKPS